MYPWLLLWDIAFLENMFYVWPPSELYDRDEFEHCNWQGWWYKTGRIYVDINMRVRECAVGVYDYLIDSGDFGCASASYSVSKVSYRKLEKYAKKDAGLYGFGPNSCKDHSGKFDSWKGLEEKSFVDSAKESASDIQDAASDDMNDAANQGEGQMNEFMGL